MIITCPNCNKQFKIDNSLIPNEGEICNVDHVKYLVLQTQNENNDPLTLNENISVNKIETKSEKKRIK